jgi:glycosyltransferase involved in cell wall biosynthesis
MFFMSNICGVTVIIPSLNPTDALVRVVKELIEVGFNDIIIVNDGSDDECVYHFETLSNIAECTVLTHPVNLGKGAALKTAFQYFAEHRSDKEGIITADGDGQHLPDDIVKCATVLLDNRDSVIMGVRDFSKPGVPFRNAQGNRITALAFNALFGIKLRDTQTGLRGIPAQFIPLMLKVKGNRFEYETNMLMEVERSGIAFYEVEIETVYEEGSNKRSQYRPFLDSVMIFSRLAKYALSSIASFIVDINVFWIAFVFLGGYLGSWSIVGSTVIARAASSFFNFNANRKLVFKRNNAYVSHLWRYYTLAVIQMLVSAGLLWSLALLFGSAEYVGLLTVLKIFVDTVLFLISFYIQRRWVFTER